MVHILVESDAVARLLLTLLAGERRAGALELRAYAHLSSLYSAARTLRVVRREPVAVVLDARSPDPVAVDRVRQEAEEVIEAAGGVAPLRILVAVPALEALVFERPEAVKRAYPAAGDDLIEIGKISPATALRRLEPADTLAASARLIGALDDEDVAALRARRSGSCSSSSRNSGRPAR